MNKCFQCGEEASHKHHVVPKSRGGDKTVPLCLSCHAKAHHQDKAMSSSELTKEGLAKAKARGVKLGNPENIKGASIKGNKANIEAARKHNAKILPVAQKLRASGETLAAIAEDLSDLGLTTRYGNPWSIVAVSRLLNTS